MSHEIILSELWNKPSNIPYIEKCKEIYGQEITNTLLRYAEEIYNKLSETDKCTYQRGISSLAEASQRIEQEKTMSHTTPLVYEPITLDAFTRGFLSALFFSESYEQTDENGETETIYFDREYEIRHLSPHSLHSICEECEQFQKECTMLLSDNPGLSDERKGTDFLFTRNHHGSGYWDGDYTYDTEKSLTDAAHKFPEINLYIGDDGLLYTTQG